MTTVPQDFLTPEQVSDRLQVSVRQVHEWCRRGKLPGAFKLPGGRLWRIPKNTLDMLCSQGLHLRQV